MSAETYQAIYTAIVDAHAGMQRPSALYRPALSVDGNMYCALYGEDLVQGCAGFGATPAKAMEDFDKNWLAMQPGTLARQEGKNAPGHTDLMVSPESIDAFLEANPLPPDVGSGGQEGKTDAPSPGLRVSKATGRVLSALQDDDGNYPPQEGKNLDGSERRETEAAHRKWCEHVGVDPDEPWKFAPSPSPDRALAVDVSELIRVVSDEIGKDTPISMVGKMRLALAVANAARSLASARAAGIEPKEN